MSHKSRRSRLHVQTIRIAAATIGAAMSCICVASAAAQPGAVEAVAAHAPAEAQIAATPRAPAASSPDSRTATNAWEQRGLHRGISQDRQRQAHAGHQHISRPAPNPARPDTAGDARLAAYNGGDGKGEQPPAPALSADTPPEAASVVRFAYQQLGKPYSWGASGPDSYDCSGLTSASWKEADVELPHNAAAQRDAVPEISRDELQPGDLVFYYDDLHHVGLYVGDDKIVHAPNAGQPVQVAEVDDMPIHSYGRPA